MYDENEDDKKIIWIASYPKSGNTWLRSFLSSYYCTQDGSFSFNLLNNIPTFESDIFLPYISKEEVAKKPHLIAKYWIEVQKSSKLKNGDFIFLKTHNFCGKINNYSFTNSKYTLAFIYIVRDPREVVISLSNHSNQSIDKCIEIITSISPTCMIDEGKNYPVYTYNWGTNYLSWKNFNSVPSLIIKYEDLISNTYKNFSKIIFFLHEIGLSKIDKTKLKRSIVNTSFSNLKKLEKIYGFSEQKLAIDKRFFNKGTTNSWKAKLSSKQVRTIEDRFQKEMKELSYL